MADVDSLKWQICSIEYKIISTGLNKMYQTTAGLCWMAWTALSSSPPVSLVINRHSVLYILTLIRKQSGTFIKRPSITWYYIEYWSDSGITEIWVRTQKRRATYGVSIVRIFKKIEHFVTAPHWTWMHVFTVHTHVSSYQCIICPRYTIWWRNFLLS